MAILKQMSWYTLGNIVTLFCQWVIIMLIPKITDFSEAGIFAVAISVASIVNQIATFSLNTYQIADGYEKFTKNSYAVARLTTITISFLCMIPIILMFDYEEKQILVILAYTVYRNLINYAYLHVSSLQLRGHLDTVGKAMIIEGFISLFSFTCLYMITNSLLISTAAMAIAGGGTFLVLMTYYHKRIIGKAFGLDLRDHAQVKQLLIIGLPLLISTLAPIIITALPKLLMENDWGTELVGIFGTLTAPTIIIPTIITSMFAPLVVHFSRICKWGDIKKLRIQYTKVLMGILLFGILGFIISFFLSDYAFQMLYGPEIGPYTHYFNILIIGIFIYSIGICGITVLVTKNQGNKAGLAAILSCLISVAIFMAMIPDGGIDGAVWGLLISYSIFGLTETICVYLPLNKND